MTTRTGLNSAAEMSQSGAGSTLDAAEVARFSALADTWWDPKGPFRPLHKFNPTRLAVIRDWICEHFGRDPAAPAPLSGLDLLDVGCGGGLVAEPMARLGARVLGLDASPRNVGTARAHHLSVGGGLDLGYQAGTAEDLVASDARFDVVLTLEVIEHVADTTLFLNAAARLTRPGGLVIAATLNRTAKAFALAILGAEYVLGWLPRGTHDWRKFVTPAELEAGLTAQGLEVGRATGFAYNPLRDRWALVEDRSVNYMVAARKPAISKT